GSLDRVTPEIMLKAKQHGFVDVQLAHLWDCSVTDVHARRKELGVNAVFKSVDTCAAEFEAYTPYYYSTYESGVRRRESGVSKTGPGSSPTPDSRPLTPELSPDSCLLSPEDEVRPHSGRPRIMILGGGPNRIGQGIEFDYCCVQAAFALRAAGYEVI